METFAGALNVPVSSAADSSAGRNKVALKPGRSLMDWIRFTHSGKDLAGTGGRSLEISTRELSKHNTRKDAWIALRGKVYNITHYLEYHPGGEDELMRGAGKDATDLFNQVHRWVNAESMLQKCFIGILKKSWSFDVPKFPPLKQLKVKHKRAINIPDNKDSETVPDFKYKEAITVPDSACEDAFITQDQTCIENLEESDFKRIISKSEWPVSPNSKFETSAVSVRCDGGRGFMKVVISCEKYQGLITDLVDKKLFVKINDSTSQILSIELPAAFQENYEVDIQHENSVKISLEQLGNVKKCTNGELDAKAANLPSCQSIAVDFCEPTDELIFWACKLLRKIPINHNTFLFTFLLPPGTKMWVPIGCHVHIKSYIEGVEVIRSFTPVVSSLDINADLCDELDGRKIVLMIKVYPLGLLTPVINKCDFGETMWISSYAGSFSELLLTSCDSVVMLAAGTGITPMIRIIKWITMAKDKRRSILLLFFNKTEEDILWKKELQCCGENYKEFQIMHILSEPSEQWAGHTGKINDDLIDQLLTVKLPELNQRIFVCGPLPFVDATLRCLENAGHNQDDVHVFTGS